MDSISQQAALSAYGIARATVQRTPLTEQEVRLIDGYWRAANYLAVGMI